MAILQKLDRLMATEILSLTFVISAGISSVMMMAKLPRYANFLFSAPDTGTTFLMLLLYIFPSIVKLTLPVSLLLACSIVMSRMSTDRELEAWMAGGVNLLRFAFMPSILGAFIMLLSLASSMFFEPYSNIQFDKFKWLQTRGAVEALIRSSISAKAFINDLPTPNNIKFSLYFQDVSQDRSTFSGVHLFTQRMGDPFSSVIVSDTGSLKKQLNQGFPDYIFSFQNGTAYSGNWNQTRFSRLDVSLINAFNSKFKVESYFAGGSDELYPKEYLALLEKEKQKVPDWKRDKSVIDKLLYFLRQFSIPISTVLLPIIGICLGIQDPRRKQLGAYLGIAIIIFALYSSVSLCQQLALGFYISPFAILFVPPFVLLLAISILLKWRLFHPPSVGFFDFLKNDLFKWSRTRKKGSI